MKDEYILIRRTIAPEVFLKVIDAKQRLSSGKSKNVSEAIEDVDLSRSAFYKYKDNVFFYNDENLRKIYTIFLEVADVAGILSDILKTLASYGSNVLTINQNVPINHMANVTISFRFLEEQDFSELVLSLKELEGVNKVELLAIQ